MTLRDDGKFCWKCKKIGLQRLAHRIMPSGGAVCDEHFREEAGRPQLTEEARTFIGRCHELEQVKRETIQRKKSKTVHEKDRASSKKATPAGSPSVLELLNAFNRKM